MEPAKKKPNAEEIATAKKWPIWEKEKSTFDWHYDSEETFLVLEGDVTVKYDGGKSEISFGAGDIVTM
nr:cupin domain-containing protein [Candidatus Sigynarchaeota archaeon]